MQWDFTPDDIILGKIEYTLIDFRNDLWDEIRDFTTPAGFPALFWALYHLAMGYSPQQMAQAMKGKNQLSADEIRNQVERFETIRITHENEIDMLRGIIKRRIVEYHQEGLDVIQDSSLPEYIQRWIDQIASTHTPEATE